MEAPGVPWGAAPVRGPPSSCAAQSGAGAQAPLFPPLLSALAVPPEADLGSPRGPGSTLHPGSTTSGTSRDQGHVQDGHAPCPDRGNTRLPLWRKTQEADTCSSPQTSGFLISETRFLPVSERREPRASERPSLSVSAVPVPPAHGNPLYSWATTFRAPSDFLLKAGHTHTSPAVKAPPVLGDKDTDGTRGSFRGTH